MDEYSRAGSTATSERRIVTVLFADLVGFTTLAEGLDPEDLATVQDAYFATVREVVGRYRGQLEKFIGDAAMAVFGTPRAEDDDAVRAVQAGLTLVHAVGDLGARLGLEAEAALRLRVGVNTGEVLVATAGPDAGRVSGDTVNVAARLQTAAAPGGVLVGNLTALSVGHAVELDAVEPLALKGKRDPVPASRVVAMRPEPSRELAMGRLQAPMLGREAEIERLRAVADAAGRGGAARVLIVAPPGVGKTRLLEALAGDLASDAWHVTRGRTTAGEPAFDPVARLVRTALDGPAMPAGGGRAAVVRQDVRSLLEPGVGAASRDRSGLFASCIEAIGWAAGGRPQAWLLEDLHWAGGDLLAFLDAAMGEPGARRLVVATARPQLLDELGSGGASEPETARRWDVLHLSTLSPTACAAVLEALVGDAIPPPLARRIVERSDGNCLFVEELLRSWAAVGLLVDEGGRWRLTVDAAEVPLPQTVQAIYAGQLDDLPSAPRAVVRRGAVAGRRVPVAALEPLGVPAPAEALETLRRRAILNGPLPGGLDGEAYAFRHALLRDAGYASLGRAERADLHVALARWLEAIAGERVAEAGAEIGRHYAEAHGAAPALAPLLGGLTRGEVAALARHWLASAADRDLARFATSAAADGFRRAIALTPGGDRLALAGLRRRLGQALSAEDLDAAVEVYLAAIDDARAVLEAADAASEGATEARDVLARAAAGASAGRYEQVRFAEALSIADDALETLRDAPVGDRVAIARLRALEGLDNDYATLAQDARMVAERISTRGGDPAVAFEARRAALAFEASGGPSEVAAWDAVAAEATELGRVEVAVGAMVNGAAVAFDDDRQAAFERLDRAEDLAARYALYDRLGWVGQTRTELWLATGDWDRAAAAGRSTIDLGIARSFHRIVIRTMSALVPIAHARRDIETLALAADWFDRWRSIFPGSPYGTVLHHAVDLRLADAGLAIAPPVDEGRLAEGIALFDDSPSWLASVEQIIAARVASGDVAGARRVLDLHDVPVAQVVARRRAASQALCRAWVLRAEGRVDEAGIAAAVALETADGDRLPWWALRALDAQGDPATLARRRVLAASLGVAVVEPEGAR